MPRMPDSPPISVEPTYAPHPEVQGRERGSRPSLEGRSDTTPIGAAMREKLSGFVATLRDNGFTIGLNELRDALAVLASPAARSPSKLKPALRALFSADRSDWQKFDEIFSAYWAGKHMRRMATVSGVPGTNTRRPRRLPNAGAPSGPPSALDQAQLGGGEAGTEEGRGRPGGASSIEALQSADIRNVVDPDEIARTHQLAARLAKKMRARLVRRQKVRRSGPRLDLRRTIHRNVSHGGTPVDLAFRRRKTKPLRIVVLLDASGSMSLYTAFFVRFLHGVVDAFHEAEAFVFHTRLVHVSATLRDRNIERAVDKLALMAEGIGGGTRIGESLADFNRWHAARVINSRSVVIIVSDGYDTGEPERLAIEMQRLRRRCRRIVWLNPLIGWRDYAPAARGMQAALPYVDLFAPAYNLESLAALEPYLAKV